MISRVLLVCLLAAAIGSAGCDERRAYEEHVLNRIGYGPDAWSRNRIGTLGVERYIDEQLHPERIDDSAAEGQIRHDYRVLGKSLNELRRDYTTPNGAPWQVRDQLSRAKMLRAVHSRHQLEQVLVDFWFNHFNVDARRRIALWAIAPYERDAIRPYVLGRFEDMLRAVARHPAMLEYLDNAENFREGFKIGNHPYGVNENFARELLELHTVGADAGQTLADIRNTALAFTGWTVDDNRFVFLADGHDRSPKRVLGLSMPSGRGIEDGDALIRYLARHPSTAVHVARKLCRRFVAERATGCEVSAAARFLATDGDLREVMAEILRSEPFRDPRYYRSKVKRPTHLIASAARAVGVADDDAFAAAAIVEAKNMGEELYEAAPPSGWPDLSQAWLGEGAFVRHLHLANRAARGSWGMRPPASVLTTEPPLVVTRVVERLLVAGIAEKTRAELLLQLRGAVPSDRLADATALVLAGPEFSHH